MKKFSIKELFNPGTFTLNKEKLNRNQLLLFLCIIILSIILKIILIPHNMMHGEAVTRVWNVLWWAEDPFFILPNMNHPLYYYLMGPIIYVFREIYYVPIFTTIIIVTISGIFLFKISYLISNYRIALLAFFIFIFNPAVFRLNFDPHPYSLVPLFYTIIVYYLIRALFEENSRKYFFLAGIFTFLASFTRPEAIFVIVCFCAVAFLSKKKGYVTFIVLSLWFQVFWILLGIYLFGSPFATFDHASEFPNIFDIHGLNLALRLKGFFLPYYFLLMGMTLVIFYFFIRGTYIIYKKYPKIVFIILFIPIIIQALVNGTASLKTSMFHSTYYIFSMFYFSSISAAFGLNKFITGFKKSFYQAVFASLVIASAIPLSYIKEFVPDRFRGLFPKVVQFLETAPNPSEVRIICGIIDVYIDKYHSLILDDEGITESSIRYIAYRTKLAPPGKILITTYNIPLDKLVLTEKVREFVLKNGKGIIAVQNNNTLLNQILGGNKTFESWNVKLDNVRKTEHWTVYFYEVKD